MCPFDYTAVAGSEKVESVNQVNHTSWVAVVTPTDRPKSVHNRCVIELFLWLCLCCHFALLTLIYISVGVLAFVIGLSQISSFFSYRGCYSAVGYKGDVQTLSLNQTNCMDVRIHA